MEMHVSPKQHFSPGSTKQLSDYRKHHKTMRAQLRKHKLMRLFGVFGLLVIALGIAFVVSIFIFRDQAKAGLVVLSPNFGPVSGGNEVVVNGEGFVKGYYRQFSPVNQGLGIANQVHTFSVDTAALITSQKMNGDCSDARIFSGSTVVQISISNCNTSATQFQFSGPSDVTYVFTYGDGENHSASHTFSNAVFSQNFDSSTDFETRFIERGGDVIFSTEDSVSGPGSGLKINSNDPGGACFPIGTSYRYNQGYIFSGFIKRRNNNGGTADRISIENDEGDGYGIQFTSSGSSNNTSMRIERRNGGSGSQLTNQTNAGINRDQWYRFELEFRSGGQILARSYTFEGTQVHSSSATDSRYNDFDRVCIRGGREYFVDNFRVSPISVQTITGNLSLEQLRTRVFFAANEAQILSIESPTVMRVLVPPSANQDLSALVEVTLNTDGNEEITSDAYQYQIEEATLIQASPSSGTIRGGTEVILTGSNLRTEVIRREIEVSHVGEALENHQVRMSLDTQTLIADGKMQTNCNDVRFFTIELDPIPYWIETGCNSTETIIWLKLSEIPPGVSTIYLEYGNRKAPSLSNVNDVFIRDRMHLAQGECQDSSVCNNLRSLSQATTAIDSFEPYYTDYRTTSIDSTDDDTYYNLFRFLFVPNQTQSYTLAVNSDDASVAGITQADFYNSSFAQAVAAGKVDEVSNWYGNHGVSSQCGSSGSRGSRTLTEGQGYWMFVFMNEWLGNEYIELCMRKQGDTNYRTVDEAIAYGTIYARSYTEVEPTLRVSSNEGVGSPFVFFGQLQGLKTEFISDTSIRVTTPNGLQAGPVDITLQSNEDQDVVLLNGFTYIPVFPTITQVVPNVGSPITTPQVEIRGNDFYLSGYRREISIQSGEVINDLQMLVQIDTQTLIQEGKMRSDCSDLLIVDAQDRVLPTFIEAGCNSPSTLVWFTYSLQSLQDSVYVIYGGSQVRPNFLPNQVFIPDSITRLLDFDCVDVNQCRDFESPQDVINAKNTFEIEQVDILTTADQAPSREYFLQQYRALFIPSESNTYTFYTNSDDASEVVNILGDNFNQPFSEATQQVLSTYYGLHPESSCSDPSRLAASNPVVLSASQPLWVSYFMNEWTGEERAQLCIQKGTGPIETVDVTSLPGQWYSRKYIPGGDPVVSLSANETYREPMVFSFGSQSVGAYEFQNSNSVLVSLPEGSGVVDVSVRVGDYLDILSTGFTYESLETSFTAFSPSQSLVTGGETLIITGNNFLQISEISVVIGNIQCLTPEIVSNTQIICEIPQGSAGLQSIYINFDGTNVEMLQPFLYIDNNLPSGLELYYSAQTSQSYSGVGQVVYDISGNNSHGFLGQSDQTEEQDPLYISDSISSFQFASSESDVITSGVASSEFSSFSVEIWFRRSNPEPVPGSFATQRLITFARDDVGATRFAIGIEGDTINAVGYDDEVSNLVSFSSEYIAGTVWNQVIANYDASRNILTVYVNGTLHIQETIQLSPGSNQPILIGLGRNPDVFGFEGEISSVRIFSEILSEQSIERSFEDYQDFYGYTFSKPEIHNLQQTLSFETFSVSSEEAFVTVSLNPIYFDDRTGNRFPNWSLIARLDPFTSELGEIPSEEMSLEIDSFTVVRGSGKNLQQGSAGPFSSDGRSIMSDSRSGNGEYEIEISLILRIPPFTPAGNYTTTLTFDTQ